MRRLALAILAAALLSGGIAILVHVLTRHPAKVDDSGEALLSDFDADAPVASDVDLPVTLSAEQVREPHARVELGKKDLRLFGATVAPMPPAGATSLAATALTAVSQSALAHRDQAGHGTLEVAVDREVRFGVVADALQQLSDAGYSPKLFLGKNAAGELRLLKPRVGAPRLRVVVDARGAHTEALPDAGGQVVCDWTSGAPTGPFGDCVGQLAEPGDAGALDAGSRLQRIMMLAMLGGGGLIDVRPARDARYGDVIAVSDAITGAGSSFVWGR